jgi:hypothetical protein
MAGAWRPYSKRSPPISTCDLKQEGKYLLGDHPIKTLRLDQDARALLLEDFRKLSSSTDTAPSSAGKVAAR